MKTEMYRFNGNLYLANDKVTLNFYVEVHCIQSFLKELELFPMGKWGYGYTIEKHANDYYISNATRKGKHIKLTLSAVSMYERLLKLGFNNYSEIRDNIYVYQYRFDKGRYGKLTCVLIWQPKRGWFLQRRNHPLTYTSIYKNNKHYVPMNNTYNF